MTVSFVAVVVAVRIVLVAVVAFTRVAVDDQPSVKPLFDEEPGFGSGRTRNSLDACGGHAGPGAHAHAATNNQADALFAKPPCPLAGRVHRRHHGRLLEDRAGSAIDLEEGGLFRAAEVCGQLLVGSEWDGDDHGF